MSGHRNLEDAYPLRVGDVEVVRGLENAPAPLVTLSDEDAARWEKMPLSKRRLATLGPVGSGQEAARMAAIIVAAECKAAGMTLDVAKRIALEMPFVTGATPRRKVLKQVARAVERFAYSPPNGQPILTGCCRDPRTGSGAPLGRTLRGYMAPYCDAACAATCPMLRAVRFPSTAIGDTPYKHIDDSDLWQHGSGYGEAGQFAWRTLALLAELTTDRVVEASATYICQRSGGKYSDDHLRRVLKLMSEDGLVPVIGRSGRTTQRHVPILSLDELRDLERRKGVFGKRASNMRAARACGERYGDAAYAMLTDEQKIEAWTYGGREVEKPRA
jgi:hypothetical protein